MIATVQVGRVGYSVPKYNHKPALSALSVIVLFFIPDIFHLQIKANACVAFINRSPCLEICLDLKIKGGGKPQGIRFATWHPDRGYRCWMRNHITADL